MMKAENIINFWFEECKPEDHFKKDIEFDREIEKRFGSVYNSIIRGETFEWRSSIQGRLAEVIVLDQFSRNMFRDKPEAFLYDPLALVLAQESLLQPELDSLPSDKKGFLFMPFMHSESKKIHEEAMKLFSRPGFENLLKYEIMHKKIIDRFGRYPHRNKILGRESTPEEIEFLKGENSSF